MTVQPGSGGYDRINIVGTVGNDVVDFECQYHHARWRSNDRRRHRRSQIDTRDGNDNVDLDLTLAGVLLRFFTCFFSPKGRSTRLREMTIANLAGVVIDPADPVIYGGDGDDVDRQVRTSIGFTPERAMTF
ncbi:MAG: hypothetical protein U0905_14970 [Pirellulales bacterium]